MTESERKQANQVLRWLRRDWQLKNNRCECKSYGFLCGCCHATRLVEQLDSLVNFFMDTDKELKARYKKWAKKELKKSKLIRKRK